MKYILLVVFLLNFVTVGFCGEKATGIASFYGREACRYNKTKACLTADGSSLYKLEYELELFAASWYYPLGSKVMVTNLENNKSVVVVIRDRGPAKRLHRQIDLGEYAFKLLSDKSKGIIKVRITPMQLLQTRKANCGI